MTFDKGSTNRTADGNVRKISLRPTFYIGLGGFGTDVVRKMKEQILRLRPETISGFAFLGLDTQKRNVSDSLSRNEYLELSLGVDPKRVAKNNPKQLDWFLEIIGSFPVKNITAGANMTKAVGRLAFRHLPTFTKFLARLSTGVNRLNKLRDGFTPGELVKVYVISTLAGGTGAGCLLDVMGVVGKYIKEAIGPNAPYQAILVTPDQIAGEAPNIQLPDLRANTYASLKEIHNFLNPKNSTVINYNKSRFKGMKFGEEYLPHVMHIVGDKNEHGSVIVDNNEKLGDILVSYLLSEIITPLSSEGGQIRVQDLENLLVGIDGIDGMPRRFSSIGVVTAGVPIDVVNRYYALKLINSTLEHELAIPTDLDVSVANWFDAMKLKESGSDQLQDSVKSRLSADMLRITIDAKGYILAPGFKYPKLLGNCKTLHKEMTKSHEDECKKPIQKQAGSIGDEALSGLNSKLETLFKQSSIGDVKGFLEQFELVVKIHQNAIIQELAEAELVLDNLKKDVEHAILDVDTACQGFWGRKGRVENAVSNYGTRLEFLINQTTKVWIMEECNTIYSKLLDKCGSLKDKWLPVYEALSGNKTAANASQLEESVVLDNMADIAKRGPGNRFSLIDSTQAYELYNETIATNLPAAMKRIRTTLNTEKLLENIELPSGNWLEKATNCMLATELKGQLEGFDLLTILDRFFPEEYSIQKLFQNLDSLSSPLYHFDPNKDEEDYARYWIIAVHPSQKDQFDSKYSQHLVGDGKCYAESSNNNEVLLYQFKIGYTITSLAPLKSYASDYQCALDQIRESKKSRKTARPVHCWLGADTWDDLFPEDESQEAAKWFILGRAFNKIFPSHGSITEPDKKNKDFLYAVGSNYYFKKNPAAKATPIGKGLDQALRNFTERVDWQEIISSNVNKKKAEVGEQIVLNKIKKYFKPELLEEIDIAEKDKDGTRCAVLRILYNTLLKYIKDELATSGI